MSGQVSLLITAAVPIIAEYLQRSSANRKELSSLRSSELEMAQEICTRQSTLLGELHFYLIEVMFASIYDRRQMAVAGMIHEELIPRYVEEDERTWNAYRNILVEWKKHRLVALAATHRYFGPDLAARLEEIKKNLGILERQVNAARFKQKDSRFYICDVLADGVAREGAEVFLALKSEFIDTDNFDFRSSELFKRLPQEFHTDYRLRFTPLHHQVGAQISSFNQAMMKAIQGRQVGAIRGG